MCNLYSVTKGQQAICEAFRAMTDHAGNLPSLPGIFPDQMAPIVRTGLDGRELAMLRWGFPSPPGVLGNRPVTNIRSLALILGPTRGLSGHLVQGRHKPANANSGGHAYHCAGVVDGHTDYANL